MRPATTASWPPAAGLSSDPSSPFTISETALTCEDGSNTIEDSGDAGALVLVRQDGACDQDIPVTVEIGDHQIDIIKPFIAGSAFTMTIDWVEEAPEYPVPPTQVDYLDGSGPHDMQLCLADGGRRGHATRTCRRATTGCRATSSGASRTRPST